jgi:hypothetical protein
MFQIIKNFYHYVQEILQICPALFFLKLQRQIQQGSWAAPKSGRQPAFGASMQLDRGRRLFFFHNLGLINQNDVTKLKQYDLLSWWVLHIYVNVYRRVKENHGISNRILTGITYIPSDNLT